MEFDLGELWREGGTLPLLFVMAVVAAAILYGVRKQDRASLANTLAVFAAGMAGVAVAHGLASIGLDAASAVTREVSVFLAGVAIIRLWGQVLFRVVLPAARLMPPRILEDLVVIVTYAGWGLVRLRLAGLDLSGIVATSAVMTAVVAFAMQDTLGNILGGLAMELDSAFEIGDWIRVDDVAGRVVDIRWRSTSIETRNWETVVIPNAHLVRSKVTVLGRRQGAARQLRRWVWFNVDLGTAPARVIDTVQSALRTARIDNVAEAPPPGCVLMDFGDGYARYAIRYWLTDFALDDPTDSAVREHALAALQRAGVRLAMAEHRLHMVAEDEAHADQVRARELARRIEALRGVSLFDELTDAERETVAQRLVNAPFARGDLITQQGAVAHFLYLLTAGSVEVTLEHPGKPPHRLAVLEAPTFFGEMGLLTGEPRRATVHALSGATCYRLNKEAFEDVLRLRPQLAHRLSRILAERQVAIEHATQLLESERHEGSVEHRSAEILAGIKRFFGIGAT